MMSHSGLSRMYYLLRTYAYSLLRELQGRRVTILSYPKCGRTWLMNMFANYLTRVKTPSAEALPFMLNQLNESFDILGHGGVYFSHGATLRFVWDRSMDFAPLKLERRKTAFFVRDPLLVSVSMYYHRNMQDRMALMDFLRSDEGIANYLWYAREVMERAKYNPRFKVFYYEDLHSSNPRALEHTADFFHWVFDAVDQEALAWAYDACLPQPMKARAVAQTDRVRKAKTTLDDEAFLPIREELNQSILDLSSQAARDVFSRYVTK